MANEIAVTAYREALAAGMRGGGAQVSPITHMAFGDGGHNADGSVRASGRPQLYRELLRKPLDHVTGADSLSATGKGSVGKSELIGQALSEAALIDALGRTVAMITFPPKVKDGTDAFELDITVKF